jgi:hypothetical protein
MYECVEDEPRAGGGTDRTPTSEWLRAWYRETRRPSSECRTFRGARPVGEGPTAVAGGAPAAGV